MRGKHACLGMKGIASIQERLWSWIACGKAEHERRGETKLLTSDPQHYSKKGNKLFLDRCRPKSAGGISYCWTGGSTGGILQLIIQCIAPGIEVKI